MCTNIVSEIDVRRDLFEITKYGVSGAAAVLTHLATLISLVQFIGLDKTIASALGFVAAIPVHYALQRSWVFEAAGAGFPMFIKYLVLVCVGMTINVTFFYILTGNGIHYVISQIISIFIVFMFNFEMGKRYVFIHNIEE